MGESSQQRGEFELPETGPIEQWSGAFSFFATEQTLGTLYELHRCFSTFNGRDLHWPSAREKE